MNYWEECIRTAFDDAGIKATDEQIIMVAGDVEGCHENYYMASGDDVVHKNYEWEQEANT